MKKVLVVLALCLSLLSGVGSAQRYIESDLSYDESSIYVTYNEEYQNFGFNVIEYCKGTSHLYEFYWDSIGGHIIYRYKIDDNEWSKCYSIYEYSDSAQGRVFRDVWYQVKGYAFS